MDEILVKYSSNLDSLKTEFKSFNDEQLKIDKTAEETNKKFGKGIDDNVVKTKSLKQQLRELKNQLAITTDPKEFERLSRSVGKLTDQIQDAGEASRIFATESKFESVSTALGGIAGKLRNLDFKGAADQSKLLLAASKDISFEDAVKGAKDLGTTLANTGKALLGNPLLILAAVMVAVATEAYGAAKAIFTINDQTKALTDSIKDQVKTVRGYKDAVQEAYIKIGESVGSLTKGQAEQKRNEIKSNNELIALKEKYATDLKAIAIEISGDEKGTQEDIAKQGVLGGAKGLANLIKFSKQKELLLQGYNLKRAELEKQGEAQSLATQVASNIERGNKAKSDIEKLLADAKKAKEKSDADEKARQAKLDADIKLLRDLRTENISSDILRQKQKLQDKFNDEVELHKGNNSILVELQKKLATDIDAVDVKQRQDRLKALDDSIKQQIDLVKKEAKEEAELNNDPAFNIALGKRIEGEIKLVKDGEEAKKKIREESFKTLAGFVEDISKINQNQKTAQIDSIEEQKNIQIAALDADLEHKIITKEQYETKKKEIDDKAREEEKKIKQAAFESQKQAAIITATINTAQAIISALTGPPLAAQALAALAALTGAAQIAVIASQPTPKFAKGVVNFKGKGTRTSDENLVLISDQESVITADATEHYSGLLKAMNKNQGGKFIQDFYIAPALKAQKKKYDEGKDKSFADNLMRSITMNGNFKDVNLLDSLKQSRKNDRDIALFLAKELRGVGYNPRSVN